jgi:ferredoxin-NADP reductase
MYRLVLYYLIGLLAAALALSVAGLLFDPYALLFSTAFLLGVAAIANAAFARAFGVAPNSESVYISALILALIITPIGSLNDLWFLGWSAVLAMAAKYMLAIRRKHIFNPVALAVALTALTIDQSASWWIGSAIMLPFVLVGGLLLVRKLRRLDLVASFLITVMLTVLGLSLLGGQSPGAAAWQTLASSPLIFFAGVILTEPLTMPPTRAGQRWYALIVGVLFAPQVHLGGWYATPEIAILVGNLFAYLISPKARLALRLKKRVQIAPDIMDFVFEPAQRLKFAPGQYMEWTLGHRDADSRGNRRYFTLASAPSEDQLRIGVKFAPDGSSFKRALRELAPGQEIMAGQLAGDFTLPRNPQQRCVFLAGGVGITPFRSMIKHLLDTGERRPITLIYVNRTAADIIYRDVLDAAQKRLGIRTIYTLTDARAVPPLWDGQVGYVDAQFIQRAIPDYQRCRFYISGPKGMVDSFRATLADLQVSPRQIKVDFFAGLA